MLNAKLFIIYNLPAPVSRLEPYCMVITFRWLHSPIRQRLWSLNAIKVKMTYSPGLRPGFLNTNGQKPLLAEA